jgi:hypothetical protein
LLGVLIGVMSVSVTTAPAGERVANHLHPGARKQRPS